MGSRFYFRMTSYHNIGYKQEKTKYKALVFNTMLRNIWLMTKKFPEHFKSILQELKYLQLQHIGLQVDST